MPAKSGIAFLKIGKIRLLRQALGEAKQIESAYFTFGMFRKRKLGRHISNEDDLVPSQQPYLENLQK